RAWDYAVARAGRRAPGDLPVRRDLVQPRAAALESRLPQSGAVRAGHARTRSGGLSPAAKAAEELHDRFVRRQDAPRDHATSVGSADLLAHGLIRASFVPRAPIQELRDLTRTRKQLVRERRQHVQWLQKILEDANLKLASVM